MIYKILGLLAVILLYLTTSGPASANFCRQLDHHQVCVKDIKRSAKKYWEYRASLTIDDRTTALEFYDCRHRFRIDETGETRRFQINDGSELVCQLYKE